MLLQRNLLYAVLTRACDLVVESRRAVAIAVRNQKQAARYTGLCDRFAGAWPFGTMGR